ncbi:MAG: macro domain-containing protein [Lachnospiraceae bacterium]|nr:macro domain-containing protein [Lachnospiraceae bacterium]
MPFEIKRSDITKMDVEAVVLAEAIRGSGTDASAGPREPVIEPGTGTGAKHQIRAEVYRYADEDQQERSLRQFYRRCLSLADEKGIRSLAFPLIPAGRGVLSRFRGVRIAAEEIRAYVKSRDMQVCLVIPGFDPMGMRTRLRRRLDEYIAENMMPAQSSAAMDEAAAAEEADSSPSFLCSEMPSFFDDDDGMPDGMPAAGVHFERRREAYRRDEKAKHPQTYGSLSAGSAPDSSPFEELESKLAERMEHMSDTFSEYLLYLIRMKGMTNSEVYKRAVVDKKVFSKIRNNPDYHPQKRTALCLCIGARLSLDEAKDLLARAGYALSPCDKTDIIFSYFLEHKIYDMIELDIQLEEHGLPCIIE